MALALTMTMAAACTTTTKDDDMGQSLQYVGKELTNTRDDIHVEVPQGWASTFEPENSPNELVIARDLDAREDSLSVMWDSPEDVIRASRGDSQGGVFVHIKSYRDERMRDTEKAAGMSNIESLGERTIGGADAAGYSYVYGDDRGQMTGNVWFLWRHDGLWEVSLNSPLNDPQISPDLEGILDTLTWSVP